ncbi:hypothetical protein Sp245p_19145 (plasmid) [Azospirillum baldaniorum]|uniref:ABM domain-containing protein n=1 Tax=Azospirillum baldaniorum TaxID=1064539 RepID=A0A9P1NP21_9PROT|nr:hypothetical protein [Azospirillum baldaniorum]AWJ91916.1 hypothetical protein Sp245p_19145 [Azospirillum baldaniorum]TWA73904.1 hypothetical protein FBZ85_114131 [Azospirillum brasilense]CCD00336.1 protein of unknown function [Azospirillum baldaniorum]
MYARMTRFRLKLGTRDEWFRLRDGMAADIHALKGLKHWFTLQGDDDEVVVVAIHDSVWSAEAAMPDVLKLWQRIAHLMDDQPSTKFYDVTRFDTIFDTV